MGRHTGHTPIGPPHRGAAAAMGNFDGVHRGHQAVIDAARRVAAATGAPVGVVTFEPHPRRFFAPNAPPFRLMTATARAHRLARLGVDQLYELTFDAALSERSAEAFVSDVLVRDLGLQHVVVGADFRFGKNRAGTADRLAALGAAAGIGVTVADLVAFEAGPVSSTAIRAALSAGKPEIAAEMLGHWHRIEGRVEHGEKRGRDLGYPTANLALDGLHLPRFGVYAVKFGVLDGPHRGAYLGAASLGVRPMFGENRPNLETFVLDFSGDLYGAAVSVALVAHLRDEVAYEGVEALVRQMDRDVENCRKILAERV